MTEPPVDLRSHRTIRLLAQRSGLTLRALRYYEELGLIAVIRDRSGQRIYPPETCRQVMAIALLRNAGVGLPDICAILQSDEGAGGEAAQRALALEKLAAELAAQRRYADRIVEVIDIVRRGELGRVVLAPAAAEPVGRARESQRRFA